MQTALKIAGGWIFLGLIVLYFNYRFWNWLGEPKDE